MSAKPDNRAEWRRIWGIPNKAGSPPPDAKDRAKLIEGQRARRALDAKIKKFLQEHHT